MRKTPSGSSQAPASSVHPTSTPAGRGRAVPSIWPQLSISELHQQSGAELSFSEVMAQSAPFSGSYSPSLPPAPTPGNSWRSRYSQFVAVNPRCHKVKSSRVKPPRAGESMFSPLQEGKAAARPSLPVPLSERLSAPVRSLCLRSFTPCSIQALRGKGSRGRPGDSPQPLEEPLQMPAAVPEPEPSPLPDCRRGDSPCEPGWVGSARRCLGTSL